MTDRSWEQTKASLLRLRDRWRSADSETQYDFVLLHIGIAMMALALVGQFGWFGVLFCFGFVIYYAARQNLEGK